MKICTVVGDISYWGYDVIEHELIGVNTEDTYKPVCDTGKSGGDSFLGCQGTPYDKFSFGVGGIGGGGSSNNE